MNEEKDNNGEEQERSKWPLIISGLIIAGLVVSYFTIPAVHSFLSDSYEILTSGNKDRISGWVGSLQFWGPLIIILAMTLQMFLIIIPSPLLMLVAILAYGPIWGTLIAITAIFVASSVGYAVGRFLGQLTINRLIGHKKKKKLEFYVNRYGIWAVIITRLAPMLSNDAISFVGGILRMGYWKFIGATLAGITPLAVLMAYFGENNQRLETGLLWTSVVSLAIFIAYVIYDRKQNPAAKQMENDKKGTSGNHSS
ncbi:MAG: TVP38/TMEM64 family protein [Bacteroidota bacterium]